ncbi:casein kinase 2 regulatory subunit [Tulasnella sp. 419]|nr:casein kinase 2 regulatory subunit [Tulasnella sp. 418]KAG8965080.1 casein kinase 2 regulatory subunit [Tulasnella sp. 419]
MSRQHTDAVLAARQAVAAMHDPTGAAGVDEPIMEDQQDDPEGYASSTPTSSLTWIAWFCSLPGHEYFCEVSEDFIEDDFNLTGLASLVPFWKEAMEMVLDVEPEDTLKIPDVTIVESSAELLYGLVHQRYILTRPGLQAMVEKYEAGHFGTCPRVYCHSTHVAPCGQIDLPGLDTVKLYCPNCNDIYTPPSSRFQGVDGAFFGTTFPHLLFQTFRELAPAPYMPPAPLASTSRSPGATANYASPAPFVNPNPAGGQKAPVGRVYVPKIYGFRVSERAKSGPRMMWLRMRPETAEELDRVDYKGRWLEDEYDDDDDDEPGDEGRHVSSLFEHEGADDEDDDEEEEEDEQGQPPPPPHGGRSGGRQRPYLGADWAIAPTRPLPLHQRLIALQSATIEAVDSDSDSIHIVIPERPRPFKPARSRQTIESTSTAPAVTETDSGSSASTSSLETPNEDSTTRHAAPPAQKHDYSLVGQSLLEKNQDVAALERATTALIGIVSFDRLTTS